MSSPTDPQEPAEPRHPVEPAPAVEAAQPAGPRTQEIPVAAPAAPAPQLPPHPAATAPGRVPTMQPTGPVDFVPGLPGGHPHPHPHAGVTGPVPMTGDAEEPPTRRSPDRSSLLVLGLVLVSLVLLETGLALRFGGESFWSDIPLWSAFATACTVLGLAAAATLLPGGRRIGAGTAWRVAAGGLVGLAAFWVLVVLPVVATDRGFLLTAALACLGGALWSGPARRS